MKLGQRHNAERRLSIGFSVLLVMVLLGASSARAEPSSYAVRAGIVAADETTTWCIAGVAISGSTTYGTGKFQRIALGGTINDSYVHPQAQQRVKIQCFANAQYTGASTTVTSSWSLDSGGDTVKTANCPASRPYAGFPRCQIEANAAKPIFVYSGSECGNGISSLDLAWISGQETGAFYEMNNTWPFPPPASPTLFNNTLTQGKVAGTDVGFNFLAGGQLWFGFGDTWSVEDAASDAVPPRSNVLARSNDFNPSDSNGIVFAGWESNAATPQIARENLHSTRTQTEDSVIAGGGFALKEGNNAYRFQWYMSVDWPPDLQHAAKINYSSVGFSVNGADWVRGESYQSYNTPVWPGTALMAPGSILVDRYNRWIYFFGVAFAKVGSPIRLARVRPTFDAVMTRTEYEYWNGSSWVKDTNGDMAEGNPGKFTSVADLVPTSVNPRSEISVAYNSYSNRYTILLHNTGTNEVELWQAQSVVGPYTKVPAYLQLPNGLSVPCFYSPQMSEHTLRGGGQDIWFLLSQWCAMEGGPGVQQDPYNVGLWGVRTYRNTVTNCVP